MRSIITGRPDRVRTRRAAYTSVPARSRSRVSSSSWPGRTVSDSSIPPGSSPIERAQVVKLSSSAKLCAGAAPRTTRRVPRREVTTPPARSSARACRLVPRETP
ncbi:hypothetical protein Hesp01_18230 [Herbidospora sp. NBRC 101105]|nr:hypothetical protein Hesp01_18230 [Herbidospora sp. NBRC 101105]